jgi:V/A-type H+-transporting ATPase subunit E
MGLEKIKEEIQQKAQEVAQAILSEAEQRAEGIREEAEREMARLQEETDARLSEEPRTLEKREAALRESVSNRMLFESKKDILDQVYQRAYEKIVAMPTEDRRKLIAAMLNKARDEIDVARVYVNDADKALLSSSVDTRPLQTDGGIICETEDGKVRVDYRFSTLFEDVREPTIHRTSQLLFA